MRSALRVKVCFSGFAICGALWLWSAPSVAQPAPNSPPSEDERQSLRERIGIESLADQLESDDAAREIALQRLAGYPEKKALLVLDRFLESGPELSGKQWLMTVRTLNGLKAQSAARTWLFRILTGVTEQANSPERRNAARLPSPEPLLLFARQSAALMLAARGDTESLTLLGRALRRTGDAAALAKAALLAHPPRSLMPIVNASGPPTKELVELLSELGDQRAFYPLREMVRKGGSELQAQAALALLRLGELEVVEWAKHRAKHYGADPNLLAAATEILLATSQPSGVDALTALSKRDLEHALSLAEQYPQKMISDVLVSWHPKLDPPQQRRLFSALAHAVTPAARPLFEAELQGSEASAAAYGLARSRDVVARQLLTQALKTKTAESLAARALVVSDYLRGEQSSELTAHLKAMSRSASRERKVVAAWGLSARDPEAAIEWLRSKDAALAAAAASTALVHARELSSSGAARDFFLEAAALLRASEATPAPDWLAAALLSRAAADEIPSSKLANWVNAGTPAQFAAARVLAARQDTLHQGLVAKLLQSPDAALRAASLSGLGERKAPRNLNDLFAAYWFEPDARIRRAALWALGASPRGGASQRLFRLAEETDPSRAVRNAARWQRRSSRRSLSPLGHEAAWLQVVGQAPGATAIVQLDGGFSLPIQIPPDGVVVVLGAAPANLDLRLATSPTTDLKAGFSAAKGKQSERTKNNQEAKPDRS